MNPVGPDDPKRVRRAWRLMSALALVLASASFLFSVVLFVQASSGSHDNCVRIHKIWAAGAQILGTPAELRASYAKGEIDREQLRRFLGWYSADCKP